jgi:hypothetical protein
MAHEYGWCDAQTTAAGCVLNDVPKRKGRGPNPQSEKASTVRKMGGTDDTSRDGKDIKHANPYAYWGKPVFSLAMKDLWKSYGGESGIRTHVTR